MKYKYLAALIALQAYCSVTQASGLYLYEMGSEVAVGVQYQASEKLRLDSGIAFDSSFYKNQDNTSLTMPSGDAWRWGIGANYQLDQKSSMGTAFEYMKMESSTVSDSALGGTYNEPSLYFFEIVTAKL